MLKKLLIIDDAPEMGALVAAMAKPLGYAAVSTDVFGQFMEGLADDPDVIVVDMMMPQVDGVEVLRYLGELQCRAGILLVSQSDRRVLSVVEEMARAAGLCVVGSLRKPFTRQELTDALRRGEDVKSRAAPCRAAPPVLAGDELLHAIAGRQLVLHYQPRIDLGADVATGAEVLVRWPHPVHGMLCFDTFGGVAESIDVANELTAMVMEHAFKDAARFAGSGWDPVLSINVPASFLKNTALPELLCTSAAGAGISPNNIIIDIRESGIVEHVAELLDILARLRLRGFNLSIHDFGTGYSMMRQIKRIPATEIRIDKELVGAMDHDCDAEVIVRKSIELGHELGMKVVADGVETREQYQSLRHLGCDLVQGRLLGCPMPAEDILAWRGSGSTWREGIR